MGNEARLCLDYNDWNSRRQPGDAVQAELGMIVNEMWETLDWTEQSQKVCEPRNETAKLTREVITLAVVCWLA